MQLVNQKKLKLRLRIGLWVLVAGIISGASSIVASGLDYIRWEASGELVSETPHWILAWHVVSLVMVVAGIVLVISGRPSPSDPE